MNALLLSPLLALAPIQELDRAALAAVVEPWLAETGVPGAVVAVVTDGRPGVVAPFGLADVATDRPMTAETRFQVGSVTKPVTATLVALLADAGALAWDDPVGDHLDLDGPLAEPTVRQLATHTSGLPRNPVNRRDLPDSPSVMLPMSLEELLRGLEETELERAPGEAWAYSNLGYAVLGALASEAADEPYDELVAGLVLEPLGMASSGVFLGDVPVPRLASCYWPEDEEVVARDPWRFGSACAFAGLVSTAGDLARFLAAQMDASDDALLTADARAALHTPRVTIDAERGRAMTPGWFVDPLPGGLRAIGHGGEVDGHSAVVVFLPDLRAGLVVLCNRGGDAAESLIRPLLGVALPRWTGR